MKSDSTLTFNKFTQISLCDVLKSLTLTDNLILSSSKTRKKSSLKVQLVMFKSTI